MSKTYVIADIHGRDDLLVPALYMIGADSPKGATCICLGDFIDRGPDSRRVIELLRQGQEDEQWKWIVLQGNHEDIMLQALDDPRKLNWWIGNGGGATLKSYGYENGDELTPLKVPQTDLDWLKNLPLTYEDEHRIYVHAGLPLDTSIAETNKEIKQWMLYREDQEYEYSDATYHNGDAWHISGKHIVHGHHQSDKHPLLKPHRTNLDGWAWYTGRLHIGVFDDKIPGGPTHVLTVIGEPYGL